RCRAMVDNVAVQLRLAGGLDHGHPARGALGAKRPGRKVSVAAVITALQAQLAGLRAFPKMPGLRRWDRQRSSSFGHEVLLITCCTPILRAIASANKAEYCGGYASSKSKVCNGEEMQATFAECSYRPHSRTCEASHAGLAVPSRGPRWSVQDLRALGPAAAGRRPLMNGRSRSSRPNAERYIQGRIFR